MTTYWVSFRIAEIGDYQSRYDALHESVQEIIHPGRWWVETTSFYLFESAKGADAIATHLKSAINPARDLVLLGSVDKKICRVIGNNTDDDIYDIVDFAKRV